MHLFDFSKVLFVIKDEMSWNFIHRTPYLGRYIKPSYDPMTGQEVVWMQCGSSRQGCCKNYGPRSVPLEDRDFAQWETDNGIEGWRLYETDYGRPGRNPNHFFHNLVLIPYCYWNGYDDYGCEENGWDLISEYEISEDYPPGVGAEAFDWLQDSVEIFAEYVQDTSCYLVNHIHMAIVLPGGILLDTKY